MELNLPNLIAHRGAPKLAPENTLASLVAAKKAGATWTEFDVTLSADNVAMILHDDTLDRTTNGHGAIAKKTYAELKKLSAGRWFSKTFESCKIPTLADYLQKAAELELGINVELKTLSTSQTDLLVLTVLETLQTLWPPHLPQPLLSSFSVNNLIQLKNNCCPYPIALNVDTWSAEKLEMARSLNCYSIHCNAKGLKKEQVTRNTEHKIKTLAYTVNDPVEAKALLALGVTALFSDVPNLLI